MPTIGVALAIPEPWATQLQDYRTALGDETATRIPTHITLVPPTDVDDDQLAGIDDDLVSTARGFAAFDVHLRGTGTFRPISPVVFVTVAEGISSCEQLARAVRRGPLDAPLQFPYHPHVTIAHHLPDETLDRAFDEMASFECVFTADEFHLYRHEDVEGWRPARDYPLGEGT